MKCANPLCKREVSDGYCCQCYLKELKKAHKKQFEGMQDSHEKVRLKIAEGRK